MGLFSTVKSSRWGQILYSIGTGLFGSLLIVLVLTGMMPLAQTVKYLPWILGFNAAVSAYTLLDRCRNAFRRPKTAGAGIGICVGVLACVLLNVLALQMTGAGLLLWSQMLVFVCIAGVLGGLGAWLSVAYASLKDRG